jgi:predicted dehydrogenase
VAIGFNRRFHPIFERARELVAAGAIGPVTAVQSVFCEPLTPEEMPEWRRRRESGGGVMLDLAIHHFDLIPWLVGGRIEAAEATIASEQTEQDQAWVRVQLEAGAVVHSFFSYRAARADTILLVGEEGTLRIDRYAAALDVQVGRGALAAVRRRRVGLTPGLVDWRLRRVIRPADEPSYRRALSAWLGAVRGGAQRLPTLEDGLRALELVHEAESAPLELVAR